MSDEHGHPAKDHALLEAVQNLTSVVASLKEALTEYPRRTEIEDRFATKEGVRKRRAQFLALILAAAAVGYFGSLSTASYCFLNARHPGVCSIIPGYQRTQDRTDKLVSILEDLDRRAQEHEDRLDKLEHQAGG